MRYVGTTARGIRTGIIKEGDNLEEIVVNSVLRASESENFKIRDRDIIGVTEAVVGIASGNYVTVDDIAEDIKNKFPNKEVGLVFPILSRNRFSMILKGIARGVDKIYMLLSYPADEVGNHLFSEDLLDKYNIKATFYVIGEKVQYNKKIIKREYEEGHEIGNHTYTHINVSKNSYNKIKKEIKDTQSAVKSVTGTYPKTFRPPYRAISKDMCEIIKSNNMNIVLWSYVDARDWSSPGVSSIIKTIENGVQNGCIILLHDYNTTRNMKLKYVLILVLLELILLQFLHNFPHPLLLSVLILVLLELILLPISIFHSKISSICFNPCFIGTYSFTR